jgi:hypothetical protein
MTLGHKGIIKMNVQTLRISIVFLCLGCVGAATAAESIEAQLKRLADETRKSLPMMVSEDVQATNIAAVGKILMHRYNFTRRKSAIPNLNSLKREYFQNSVNAACTNPDTVRAFSNGVSLDYQYYDSANEFVMQYTLDAGTCRKR